MPLQKEIRSNIKGRLHTNFTNEHKFSLTLFVKLVANN